MTPLLQGIAKALQQAGYKIAPGLTQETLYAYSHPGIRLAITQARSTIHLTYTTEITSGPKHASKHYLEGLHIPIAALQPSNPSFLTELLRIAQKTLGPPLTIDQIIGLSDLLKPTP